MGGVRDTVARQVEVLSTTNLLAIHGRVAAADVVIPHGGPCLDHGQPVGMNCLGERRKIAFREVGQTFLSALG